MARQQDLTITQFCAYIYHMGNLTATPIHTLFQANTVFSCVINATSLLFLLQVSSSVNMENRWGHWVGTAIWSNRMRIEVGYWLPT